MKPKKPKEGRETHITVKLSLAERAALDAAAERAGLANGSYVRSRLFDGPIPRQVRRPPVERKELARLLGVFGKIGSNMNQIARAMNQGQLVYEVEIAVAFQALLDMRDATIRALGREP